MAKLKGTWRFNEVLTAYSTANTTHEIAVNFKGIVDVQGVSVEVNANKLLICYATEYNEMSVMFGVTSMVPDISANFGLEIPADLYVYINGWDTAFGKFIETITFPTEQEVSAEFYAWFTANAVEVVEHTVSGVWKFKDVPSAPSASVEQTIEFTSQWTIPQEILDALVEQGADISGVNNPTSIKCNKMIVGRGDDAYFDLQYNIYECNSFATFDGLQMPLMNDITYVFVQSNDGEYYWSYDTKTIDFGTEPQTVSAEFYEWLTANATQPTAKITYNGSAIANLFNGQTATLKCKGDNVKMLSDIVVEVAEQTGGADSKTIIPLTVTENGVYDVYYETATEVWDNNTEYEGSVTVNGVTLSFKKAENLIVPDDLNELKSKKYSYSIDAANEYGATGNESGILNESLGITNGVVAAFNEYAVLWVKSAAPLNAQFGISFLEDNTAYVTNYLQIMLGAYQGVSYCKVSVTAPSKKNDDVAYCPVTVELPISENTLTLTSLAGQNLTQMEDVYYRYFTIKGPTAQTLNVTPSAVAQYFTPDYGKCFTEVTVGAMDLSDLTKNHILCGIYIKTFPKTEYKVYDWPNLEGGVIVRQYTDGTTEEIDMTDYDNVKPSEFTTAAAGTYICFFSYTEGGITAKTTMQYTVTE